MSKSSARVVLYDIEASNLSADFGRILSFGWKELGAGKTHVRNINETKGYKKDPTNDKELALLARDVLGSADIIVGWYSQRFDLPFINSRLLAHGESPVPPVAHVDGWRIARYQLHLHSNRLASVSAFLEVEEKTPLLPKVWARATAGDEKALRYVGAHCKQDVVVLEQVYKAIRPFCLDHPNYRVLGREACPICGASASLKQKGHRITRTGRHARFQCKKCGGWSKGKHEGSAEAREIR